MTEVLETRIEVRGVEVNRGWGDRVDKEGV